MNCLIWLHLMVLPMFRRGVRQLWQGSHELLSFKEQSMYVLYSWQRYSKSQNFRSWRHLCKFFIFILFCQTETNISFSSPHSVGTSLAQLPILSKLCSMNVPLSILGSCLDSPSHLKSAWWEFHRYPLIPQVTRHCWCVSPSPNL